MRFASARAIRCRIGVERHLAGDSEELGRQPGPLEPATPHFRPVQWTPHERRKIHARTGEEFSHQRVYFHHLALNLVEAIRPGPLPQQFDQQANAGQRCRSSCETPARSSR